MTLHFSFIIHTQKYPHRMRTKTFLLDEKKRTQANNNGTMVRNGESIFEWDVRQSNVIKKKHTFSVENEDLVALFFWYFILRTLDLRRAEKANVQRTNNAQFTWIMLTMIWKHILIWYFYFFSRIRCHGRGLLLFRQLRLKWGNRFQCA